MTVRTTRDGDFHYEPSLIQITSADEEGRSTPAWQWSIVLQSIVDEDNGHIIYDILNRHWRSVGPIFKKQDDGIRYLGLHSGRVEKGVDPRKNWDRLIEEYTGLFDDEIQTRQRFHGEVKKSFGRPSQGRAVRLQTSVTPELNNWIEKQKEKDESVSQTIYRLLEDLRTRQEAQ